MTSANVIEYRIENIDGEYIGNFRKNVLCKLPDYADLLQYQPLNQHQITPYGYDEEEEYWEDSTVNLERYMRRRIPMNKVIKEYFEKVDKEEREKLWNEFVKDMCFTSSLGNVSLSVLDPEKIFDWCHKKIMEDKNKDS